MSVTKECIILHHWVPYCQQCTGIMQLVWHRDLSTEEIAAKLCGTVKHYLPILLS